MIEAPQRVLEPLVRDDELPPAQRDDPRPDVGTPWARGCSAGRRRELPLMGATGSLTLMGTKSSRRRKSAGQCALNVGGHSQRVE